MKTLILLGLTFTLNALADVSKENVETMLQQMVKENVISKEEAEKAKSRLHAVTPEQWAGINKTAYAAAARMPASENGTSQNRIEEVNGIDLDGAQFQAIQNDLRKIVPQYND